MRHWEIPRSAMGTRHLVDAAQERGIAAGACLAGTGLLARDLAPGNATVAAWQEVMVAGNLAGLADGEETLGLELGRRLPVAAYGATGTALRAARTANDVLDLTRRFAALLPGLTRVLLTPDPEPDVVALTFDGRRLAGPGRRLLVERDISAGYLALSELLGRDVPLRRLELPHGVDDPGPWQTRFGVVPSVGTPDIARWQIDTSDWDGTFPGADPAALRAATTACQQLLDQRRAHATAAHQVMVRLWNAAPDLPDFDTLASSLLTTPRTLRRRLADERTSYQRLADQVRLRIATQMLATHSCSVADVAAHLGYGDTAAFSNAFRRWTGLSPRAWSQQDLASNPFGQQSLQEPNGETDRGRRTPIRRTA